MSTSVADSAAFDGMLLLKDGAEAGGAFSFDDEARQSATADVGDGWTVEVCAGSRVVVARGRHADSAKEAHALSIKAAQQGLDLLSIRGLGDLLIQRAEDEHLAWWTSDGHRLLRAYSVSPLRIDVPPVTAKVTDATGKEVPSAPELPPVWHPSFRYFRLAQVSEEVFDAYRNLYLALESILSTAVPPNPGERETDWLPRALRDAEAQGLNLAEFAPKGAPDAIAAIVGDLYSTTRTATFHAKASKPTLLPLDPIDRRAVLDSLSRLASLYVELTRRTLGIRRPGGGIFRGGFDMMVRGLVNEAQVHVSDDPVPWDPTQTSINPGGGLVRTLATEPTPELDQPFVATFMGEASVHELAELSHVARIVATTAKGELACAGQLDGRLTLGGFDLFQAAMGVRGLNVRTPRSFFDV